MHDPVTKADQETGAADLAYQLLASGRKPRRIRRELRSRFGIEALACRAPIARAHERLLREFDFRAVEAFRAADHAPLLQSLGPMQGEAFLEAVSFYYELARDSSARPTDRVQALLRLSALLGLDSRGIPRCLISTPSNQRPS